MNRSYKILAVLALMLALYALLEAGSPANDGTDTGVGCVDDCLDPIDTTADQEPIPF